MDALGLTLGREVPICATPTQHPPFPTLCPEAQPKPSIRLAQGKIQGCHRPHALLWEWDRTVGKALLFWLWLLPCSSWGGSPRPSGTVVAMWVCEEDNKLLCLG